MCRTDFVYQPELRLDGFSRYSSVILHRMGWLCLLLVPRRTQLCIGDFKIVILPPTPSMHFACIQENQEARFERWYVTHPVLGVHIQSFSFEGVRFKLTLS